MASGGGTGGVMASGGALGPGGQSGDGGRGGATSQLSEFTLPRYESIYDIVVSPEGDLWYVAVGFEADCVGRLTPAGKITEFDLPDPGANPYAITWGPDGALWFAEFGAGKIGRMTTTGTVSEFAVPGGTPSRITNGPDGNLWFADPKTNSIGRATPSGVITEFPIPTANSQPAGITSGSDGNLWFAESLASTIGRITPDGAVTEFHLQQSYPDFLTLGSDGNVWFIDGRVSSITPAGVVATVANVDPTGIAFAADGNLWFTEWLPGPRGGLGCMTTSGDVIVRFPLPVTSTEPGKIVAGTNRDLWFIETLAAVQLLGDEIGHYRL